jgi:hypothetical protein
MRRRSESSRRLTAVLLGSALSAAALSPLWAQSKTTDPGAAAARRLRTGQPRTALVASGDTPDLFLLYTGGVIGYLDPCG